MGDVCKAIWISFILMVWLIVTLTILCFLANFTFDILETPDVPHAVEGREHWINLREGTNYPEENEKDWNEWYRQTQEMRD